MKPASLSTFARRLRREWRKLALPVENESVVVAVSGGADSAALLAAVHELSQAKKLKLRFIIAHFNHGLRGAESDNDSEFVRNLSENFGFEFICGAPDPEFVINSQKGNLEQAARLARYDFLERTTEKVSAFAVLTAHTLNDQAETFLLRLIRGSGADGLGGMKSIRNLNSEILLIRPLLSWALRTKVEDYCREQKIEFRCDVMNKDLRFSRVRVRREFLPLLAELNPKILETLAQTADFLREDSQELNRNAQLILDETINSDGNLVANYVTEKPFSLRLRVLRLWLRKQRGDLQRLDAKHLQSVDKLIFSDRGGSTVELPGGGIVVKKGKLLVYQTRKG